MNPLFYLVLILLHLYYTNAETVVKAIAFIYDEKSEIYTPLINAFNEYSKEKNLDIRAELVLLTPQNSTSSVDSYGSLIDHLLQNKSRKYDIYFYYGGYTTKYGEHLADLKEYVPKDHLNLYNYDYLEYCNVYKDQLVGLPLYLDINALYSNIGLLQKYNKTVPKTWDEMIDTAKYIIEKEKKFNNKTELIGYNGCFNEQNGSLSVYEFIHSFRESNSDPHPEHKSQATKDALMKYKQIKDEISSDSSFLSNDEFTTGNLFSPFSNAIFLKFWYLPVSPFFYQSALPGKKEGVSGSVVLATNVAICKYSKNKKAATEVLKFFTSRETQKNIIIPNGLFSSLYDLYSDPEVCKVINCDVIKAVQPMSSININKDDFGDSDYVDQYRMNFHDYLFNNKSLDVVIKKIDDMLAIHTISVSSDETNVIAIIVIVLYSVLAAIMVLSLGVLFSNKLKVRFQFLPADFWIISVLGTVMFMSSVLTYIGNVSSFKCHLNIFLMTMGLLLNISPILYKLICEYPKENKCSTWIKENKNRYIYIVALVLMELIINGMLLITPYKVETEKVSSGENFDKCVQRKTGGKIISGILFSIHLLILIVISFLIYSEWNIEHISVDVKFLMGNIFIVILSFVIYIVMNLIDTSVFFLYTISLISIGFVAAISTYFFTYAFRIFLTLMYNEEEEASQQFLKKIIRNTKDFSTDRNTTTNGTFSISSNGANESAIAIKSS